MALRGTHKRRLMEDLFQAGAAAAAGALLLWAGHQLRDGVGYPFVPAALRSLTDLQAMGGLAASCAGVLVLAWWTVGLGAGFASALLMRGGSPRAARAVGRFSPGFLRRLAAVALGLQLAAAPLPALAAQPGTPGSGQTPPSGTVVQESPAVNPAWQPSGGEAGLPTGPATAGTGSTAPRLSERAADPAWKPAPGPVDGSLLIPGGSRAGAAASAAASTVTVSAGDTLWSLAAAQLGHLATDQEVARYWPAWHETNRSVIGADPHRLLPGQVLAVPPVPD